MPYDRKTTFAEMQWMSPRQVRDHIDPEISPYMLKEAAARGEIAMIKPGAGATMRRYRKIDVIDWADGWRARRWQDRLDSQSKTWERKKAEGEMDRQYLGPTNLRHAEKMLSAQTGKSA